MHYICGFVRPSHNHIIILHEKPTIQLHVSRQNSCDDCTIRLWVIKRKCKQPNTIHSFFRLLIQSNVFFNGSYTIRPNNFLMISLQQIKLLNNIKCTLFCQYKFTRFLCATDARICLHFIRTTENMGTDRICSAQKKSTTEKLPM